MRTDDLRALLPDPPRVPPDGNGRAELLRSVLEQPYGEPAEPRHRRPSRRLRRVVVGAVAAALAGSAATAYAVAHRSPARSTGVECFLREPDLTALVIGGVSGDPVADCASEWHRLVGTDPPDLMAYDTGRGSVAVYAQGLAVPSGLVPLSSTFVQDPAAVELSTSVDDEVDGLGSGCWSTPDAQVFAQREVTRVGAVGVRVVVDVVADGTATCASAGALDEDARVLHLRASPARLPASALTEQVQHAVADNDAFLAELRTTITGGCLPLQAAADAVRAAAARHPESTAGLDVRTIADPGASCTRVDLVPAGITQVVLRGPRA